MLDRCLCSKITDCAAILGNCFEGYLPAFANAPSAAVNFGHSNFRFVGEQSNFENKLQELMFDNQ
jgi:hypothetical protein